MAKITMKQVVDAVKRLKARRGARLKDVVEEVHRWAVEQALQNLVESGALEQKGRRFRVTNTARRQRCRRVTPEPVAARGRKRTAYRSAKRRNDGRVRSNRMSIKNSLEHLGSPASCYTLVGSSPSRSRSSSTGYRRCKYCHRRRSYSQSSSDSDLMVNRRLANTRDSLEILKERLSNMSANLAMKSEALSADRTQPEVSDVATSMEQERHLTRHWINQNPPSTSVDSELTAGSSHMTR